MMALYHATPKRMFPIFLQPPPLPLSATQISAQHMSKSKDSIIDIWPL